MRAMLIFIDTDKENYPDYLRWAVKLSRRGTVIIADNVVRNGAVIDPASSDPRVQGVRRFYEVLATIRDSAPLPFKRWGTKGYDGFAMTLVVTL